MRSGATANRNMRGLILLVISCCSFFHIAAGQEAPPQPEIETMLTLQKNAAEANESPVLQKYLVRLGDSEEQINLSEIDLKAESSKWTAPVTELIVYRHNSGYFGGSLHEIAKFSKLRRLEFQACSFDKEGGHLDQIAKGCPELEELSFHSCWFERPVIRLMATFPKLKKLNFEVSYAGDGVLNYAQSFPKLETISLFQSGAGDREAAQLAKLPFLKKVDIQECSMTAKGIRQLASMKSMKQVFAVDIDISDEDAEKLQTEFSQIQYEVYGEASLRERDKPRP